MVRKLWLVMVNYGRKPNPTWPEQDETGHPDSSRKLMAETSLLFAAWSQITVNYG